MASEVVFEGVLGTVAAPMKAYHARVADGWLKAVVSHDPAGKDGRLIWRISVSHTDAEGTPDRCPVWDELKMAAYKLVPADVPMVLILPRRSTPTERYVNLHTTCLHLWESEDAEIDL